MFFFLLCFSLPSHIYLSAVCLCVWLSSCQCPNFSFMCLCVSYSTPMHPLAFIYSIFLFLSFSLLLTVWEQSSVSFASLSQPISVLFISSCILHLIIPNLMSKKLFIVTIICSWLFSPDIISKNGVSWTVMWPYLLGLGPVGCGGPTNYLPFFFFTVHF